MKHYICLILLLFSIISCEEEIPSYNDLTPGEQEAIRNHSRNRCLSESASTFTDFKELSNERMEDFVRGKYWKIVYKSGSTTTTSYINVWKVSGTTVYFLYKQLVEGIMTYNFIKMDTTLNGLMIDDIRVKKCDKEITVTGSSSALTIKVLDVESTEGSDTYRTDSTYTVYSTQPMLFAYLSKKIAKKKLDDNNDVTSTENFDYTVTYVGIDEDQLEASYNHANYSNRKFCVINYTLASPLTFNFPYSLYCVTSDASNVNIGGSASVDFTPNAEL